MPNAHVQETIFLSERIFCDGGNILSLLHNMEAISLMWLPNTRNMSSDTEELNFTFYLIFT